MGTDNNCPPKFQILLRPCRARATRSRYGEQEDVTQTRSGGVKTENNGTIWDFLGVLIPTTRIHHPFLL